MNKKYRKAIIAGNWKMNKLPSEAKAFVEELRAAMPKAKTCETVICVPAVTLASALRAIKDSRISVGGQDVSEHGFGAYTGETAAEMLADLGAKYCVVGHSERREYHRESDAMVNTKTLRLLENGVTPIICVGESLEQREKGLTMEFVAYQVKAALAGFDERQAKRCVIAYEPIWAIGTGRTATSEQAEEVCREIRAVLRHIYGARAARAVSILYGGSMNGKNCDELLAQPDIDGGLIGGASLKPQELAKIVTATAAE
ncbi:MAG: triose-phosphate isomerase [Oscillospiraceae bacterium]